MCVVYVHVGTGSWNPPARTSGGVGLTSGRGSSSSYSGVDKRTSGGVGVTSGRGSSLSYGGVDKCPRCGKTVYMAEKIVGAGSVCTVDHAIQCVSMALSYCMYMYYT